VRRETDPDSAVAPESPEPVPPDSQRPCTAEIEWRQTGSEGRFFVVARAAGAADGIVAKSRSLEWPPASPASVQALADATQELEDSLARAGWRALPPGDAWYAKRFAWEPLAAPLAPAARREGSSPFARRPAWPAGSCDLWRCQISWDAGWVESRFRVLAYGPRGRRGRAIAESDALRWLLMGQPDPRSAEHQRAVGELESGLQAAGWEGVGQGADWYSRRFVWRRDEAPVGKPTRHAYTNAVRRNPPEDLERLFRAARPTPRPEFVHDLERSLRLRRAKPDRHRLHVAVAAVGLASVLAALVVAMSVAGLVPYTSDGSPAEAEQHCRTVVVERMERRPYFVRGRDGEIHVRYREQVVPRFVRRCR
jgi:hypothetical protein